MNEEQLSEIIGDLAIIRLRLRAGANEGAIHSPDPSTDYLRHAAEYVGQAESKLLAVVDYKDRFGW